MISMVVGSVGPGLDRRIARIDFQDVDHEVPILGVAGNPSQGKERPVEPDIAHLGSVRKVG